jgi:hypothetical protein
VIAVPYTSPDEFTVLDESATLDGADLLPGFTLPLVELFARASRRRGSPQ